MCRDSSRMGSVECGDGPDFLLLFWLCEVESHQAVMYENDTYDKSVIWFINLDLGFMERVLILETLPGNFRVNFCAGLL